MISLYIYLKLFIIILEWDIIYLFRIKFRYIVFLDIYRLLFLSIVLFISRIVILYRIEYIKLDNTIKRFYLLLIIFIISICLIILSPRIIRIILGWDGLGLISYCLVIYYNSINSLNSGILTIICNRLGDIGLLIGICLCRIYGSWNLILFCFYENNYLNLFLLLAALTKRAQLPFSIWLPAAITAPTPISSLVHSSTLVTAGVYLLIRYNDFIQLYYLNYYTINLFIITIFISGFMANFEFDLKKIIALSTLSQLRFIFISLIIGFNDLAFFHLIIHALFKSLIFLCAGDFIHSNNGDQDIRNYKNIINIYPVKRIIIIFRLIRLIGFPYFRGFYSKDIIIEIFFNIKLNTIFIYIFFASILFTIRYRIRLIIFLIINRFGSLSYIIFDKSKYILLRILVLFFIIVIFGYLFMIIVFNKFYFLIFILDKILILEFYILGFYFGKYLYLERYVCFVEILYFITRIFFLGNVYKILYLDLFKIIFKYETFIEKGWIEWIIGLYIYKYIYYIYIEKLLLIKKEFRFNNLILFYIFMFIFIYILIF